MIVIKTSIGPARNTECSQRVDFSEALRTLVCEELAHDARVEKCTDTCIITERVTRDEKVRVTFSNWYGSGGIINGPIHPLPEAIRIYREQPDARIGLRMALLIPSGITEPADIEASIGIALDDVAAAVALACECPGTSFRELIAA